MFEMFDAQVKSLDLQIISSRRLFQTACSAKLFLYLIRSVVLVSACYNLLKLFTTILFCT